MFIKRFSYLAIFICTILSANAFWDKQYQNCDFQEIGWYYPELDPDIRAVLNHRRLSSGSLLEVGTGPGTQAIGLAQMGFTVTATDISKVAVRRANQIAIQMGVPVNFKHGCVINDPIDGQFDIILDRACLHCIQANSYPTYVQNIRKALKPGGLFLLKCNSKKLRNAKAHRFNEAEIFALFGQYFTIELIQETVYYSSYNPNPPALFIVMKRR